LNLAAQVSEKLEQRKFVEVAEALEGLRGASSKEGYINHGIHVQVSHNVRDAFTNSCKLVRSYFYELSNRITNVSVNSIAATTNVLQIFDQGVCLDKVDSNFGIAAERVKIHLKIGTCIQTSEKTFELQLQLCQFEKAHTLISTFTSLALLPETKGFKFKFNG
jgi:hypothetical protein